jgi:hypothetical protein
MEVLVGLIGAASLVLVAVIERRGRKDEEKWENNTNEHNALVKRVEDIGSNLGRSIDRVESNLGENISRLANKIEQHDEVLFNHLATHAEQEFQKSSNKTKGK